MARSVLLGATVFTLAALTGALLSGAAPAGPTGSGTAAVPVAVTASTTDEHAADTPGVVDPVFAQSMVYSGAAALAVSIVGLVMVGRRRRLW